MRHQSEKEIKAELARRRFEEIAQAERAALDALMAHWGAIEEGLEGEIPRLRDDLFDACAALAKLKGK